MRLYCIKARNSMWPWSWMCGDSWSKRIKLKQKEVVIKDKERKKKNRPDPVQKQQAWGYRYSCIQSIMKPVSSPSLFEICFMYLFHFRLIEPVFYYLVQNESKYVIKDIINLQNLLNSLCSEKDCFHWLP